MKYEVLSETEFLTQMKRLTLIEDVEERHVEMDGLMMRQLIALGYSDAINVFIETKLWYA